MHYTVYILIYYEYKFEYGVLYENQHKLTINTFWWLQRIDNDRWASLVWWSYTQDHSSQRQILTPVINIVTIMASFFSKKSLDYTIEYASYVSGVFHENVSNLDICKQFHLPYFGTTYWWLPNDRSILVFSFVSVQKKNHKSRINKMDEIVFFFSEIHVHVHYIEYKNIIVFP